MPEFRARGTTQATEFPVVVRQRFWPIRLNELLDYGSYLVKEFVRDTPDARALADKVIRTIEYPFHGGQPDDTHIYNAYHGKWCRTITLDYWQSASETAALKIGDCEDSTILGVAGSLLLGKEAYVVFGYVEEFRRSPASGEGYWEVVGGHAWYYVRDPEGFGDNEFHYVESTLDTPPEEYPVVEDIRKPYVSGIWRLVPEIIWNDRVYEPVPVGFDSLGRLARFMARMRRTKVVENVGYLGLRFREKETRAKYVALARMWKIGTKPLRKAGPLSRLRWRK